MEPYGSKHCRCWVDTAPAYGLDSETWYPNAACPHHGMLKDYAAPPKDTGTYQVVPVTKNWRLEGGRLVADVVSPSAQGCSCSVNQPDPCAYCAAVTEALAVAHTDSRCSPGVDCGGMYDACATGPGAPYTTEEEPQRGVRATVQRWVRRVGDWLDPHAAPQRDARRWH